VREDREQVIFPRVRGETGSEKEGEGWRLITWSPVKKRRKK